MTLPPPTAAPVAAPAAASSDRSALRFAVVGVGAVLVDYLSYLALLAVGLPTAPAKGAAFLIGAGFAFAANGTFTFRARLTGQAFVRFAVVYAIGLAVNVGLNAAVLTVLDVRWERTAAFLVATAASASCNYVGLRRWAFAGGGAGGGQPRPAGGTADPTRAGG